MPKKRTVVKIQSEQERHVYERGYSAGFNGGDAINTRPSCFSTKRMAEVWQHGLNDGNYARKQQDQLREKKRIVPKKVHHVSSST